jgi:hypothetical protein
LIKERVQRVESTVTETGEWTNIKERKAKVCSDAGFRKKRRTERQRRKSDRKKSEKEKRR